MYDIAHLLKTLDAEAPLAKRHLWLIHFINWLRDDGRSPAAVAGRIHSFVNHIETDQALFARWCVYWSVLTETVDIPTLLADFGFAPRSAFMSELAERLRRKVLPKTPETIDAGDLFELVFHDNADAAWISALDEPLLSKLAALLTLQDVNPQKSQTSSSLSLWQHELLDAITYCASQVRATGFSSELRLRMNPEALAPKPFHWLAADVQALRDSMSTAPAGSDEVKQAAQTLRDRLEACRLAAASVYPHLQEHGISVSLVFRLRQLRERIVRIRELMDCLISDSPRASAARLFGRMAALSRDLSSVRSLIGANSSLLAAKVAERSAETGEHYITRDRAQYHSMLVKAAGGGAMVAGTTAMKYLLGGIAASVFWAGFLASVNYAVSFVLIQLLQLTLATKQPAMTAPAMAAKLKDMEGPDSIEEFVDEVTHLVRSQTASVLGNLALVAPCVLLLSAASQYFSGAPMIDHKTAAKTLEQLTLFGPTVLFAAITGVLLFVSSIIAGWAENSFALNRIDSALRYNPRITGLLGQERCKRWALFWRNNISGLAANVSLGFLLGLIPAFATFFGLGLEVRHVTLSTGQIAAAAASYGVQSLYMKELWLAIAAVPFIGLLNVAVSFYCAFRLALTANSVSGVDRKRIRVVLLRRIRKEPLSFVWPSRSHAQGLVATQPPPKAL